jgi:hypothetical protein
LALCITQAADRIAEAIEEPARSIDRNTTGTV